MYKVLYREGAVRTETAKYQKFKIMDLKTIRIQINTIEIRKRSLY